MPARCHRNPLWNIPGNSRHNLLVQRSVVLPFSFIFLRPICESRRNNTRSHKQNHTRTCCRARACVRGICPPDGTHVFFLSTCIPSMGMSLKDEEHALPTRRDSLLGWRKEGISDAPGESVLCGALVVLLSRPGPHHPSVLLMHKNSYEI